MDEDLLKMVQKHNQDLYLGNGKPALTVRMALAEKEMENMKAAAEEIKVNSRQTRLMVAGAILAIIGDIIVKILGH